MQIAIVNDTVASRKSSGSVSGDPAITGEFNLAMAEVLALLRPLPGDLPQAQNEPCGGNAPLTGADNFSCIDPTILPGGLTGDAAVKKPAIGWQGVQPVVSEVVGDSGKDVEQTPAEAKLPLDLLTISVLQQNSAQMAAPVKNPDTIIDPVITTSRESIQRLATGGGQVVTTQFPSGGGNTQSVADKNAILVFPEDGESLAPVPEKSNASVAPEKAGMKPVVQDRSEVLKAGLPGNVSPPAQPENRNVIMNVKSEEVLAAGESAGVLGKEAGEDLEKNAAVKVNGANGIEAAKSGGGTEFNRPVEDLAQSRTTQLSTVFPASNSAESSKGMALPDMKDRIVQEIRHLFNTRKDEPRTQVQLRLEPEHLGRLTVKLFFNRGEVSAHFYTGNSYVKDILEGSMQQLRDTLGQQDLKLNEALVFAGDGGSGGAGRYSGAKDWREAPSSGGHDHRALINPEAGSGPVSTQTDSSRVNYLI